MRLPRRSTLFALASASAMLALTACGAPTDGASTAESDVTNIPQSGVSDQGNTGNCWLYATAAWVESLHAARTGDTQGHLSPAYWHFWDLYDQITGDEILRKGGQVTFGGFWSRAVDIIDRYGMMSLGDFVGDDASVSFGALERVNAALAAGGALAAPGAHQDGALVLHVLRAAFGLTDALGTALTNTFGTDGTRTLRVGAQPASSLILTAHDYPVWSVTSSGGPVATTLDEVVGMRGALVDPAAPRYFTRVGPLAWNAVWPATAAGTSVRGAYVTPGQIKRLPAPASLGDGADGGTPVTSADGTSPAAMADLKPFYRRLQRAMNDGAPLPFGWMVSFNAVDPQGHFHVRTGNAQQSQFGGHETLLTDYEVVDVPGYGTIPVGFAASEAQKKAALEGRVTFFRTKNSWGSKPSGMLEPLGGYNDIDADYLATRITVCPDDAAAAPGEGGAPVGSPQVSCATSENQIVDVALPPGY
jgi:hypothetical protein